MIKEQKFGGPSADLSKQFEAHSPQQVNELESVRSLSNYVVELQKLEDEIKIMEEKLKQKKKLLIKYQSKSFPKLWER